MKKAFVLTLDALTAVVLLGLFLTAMSMEMNQTPQRTETAFLQKIGQDFLTSIDKGGILKGLLSQSIVQSEQDLLENMRHLPANVGANITVIIYAEQGQDLVIVNPIEMPFVEYAGQDTVRTIRVFVSEEELQFGIAYLNLWYL